MDEEIGSNSDNKPLYLLADSQLLFWDSPSNRFVTSVRESLQAEQTTITRAAYIGASNGDNSEFYGLFTAAMDIIDTHASKMIRSTFPNEDRNFLETADLILLAGGDFEEGWGILRETGMAEIISRKYYEGTVILGVSAGALHLGMGGSNSDPRDSFTETLKLVPYYIGVHDEENDWAQIILTLQQREEYCKGFGISAGGGLIYHPDSSIEPLRLGLNEFQKSFGSEEEVYCNILLPPAVAKTSIGNK
jgi:peptidase E